MRITAALLANGRRQRLPFGSRRGFAFAARFGLQRFFGLSLRDVCRAVEANQFHFRETDDGMLYLCLNSLLQSPGEAARPLAPLALPQPLAPSIKVKKKEH